MTEPRIDPPEYVRCDWCRSFFNAADSQAVGGHRVCPDCSHEERSIRIGEYEEPST